MKPIRLSRTESWLDKTALQQGSVQPGGCACGIGDATTRLEIPYASPPRGADHSRVVLGPRRQGAGEADSGLSI